MFTVTTSFAAASFAELAGCSSRSAPSQSSAAAPNSNSNLNAKAKPKQGPFVPQADPETDDIHFHTDQPLPTTNRYQSQISTAVTDTPVAVGSLPLVYLVGTAGTARIADLDTKQDLATAPVGHNSTVAADEHRGVIINGVVVHAGPLPVEHRYGIFYAAEGSTNGAYITATESNNPDITRWRNPATRESTAKSTGNTGPVVAHPTTRP